MRQLSEHEPLATGVRGVNLRDGDQVVGAGVIAEGDEVLVITEKGYGKRTLASEYPTKGRGGKGIKTANITDRMASRWSDDCY